VVVRLKWLSYLGSKLSYDGEITAKVCCHIAKASKDFRVLIFLNQTLSVDTKRAVYKAIIISIFVIRSRNMDFKTLGNCLLS